MFISLCISIICCACLFKILKLICIQLSRIRVSSGGGNSNERRNSSQGGNVANRIRYIAGQQGREEQQSSEMSKLEKERSVKEIISLLLRKKYGEEKTYDITSCVICMENFREGQEILEIPTCNHCFHHDCCEQWFMSANQTQEKRCPLCNEILSRETLLTANKSNLNLI